MSHGAGKASNKTALLEPKRSFKPILPKLPNFISTNNTYELQHGGSFTGKGICYICDGKFNRGIRLVNGSRKLPQSGLPSKIGQLMGDSFMVVVTEDDVLCHKCHALLIHVDNLEKELKQVKQLLRGYLVSKYRITDSSVNETCSPNVDRHENSEVLRMTENDFRESQAISKTIKKSRESVSERGSRTNIHHQCTMCDMQFDTLRAIRKHKMSAHLTTWICHFCNEKFDNETTFTDHTKTHLSETNQQPSISCTFCSETFPNEQAMAEHALIHDQDVTDSVNAQRELQPVNSSESPTSADVFFTCGICDVDFVQEDVYKEHMQTHEALNCLDLTSLVKPGGLSLDGFEANSESVDLMDINIFENSDTPLDQLNRFVCGDCETEYESLAEMNKHIQSVHEMKQCSLCPDVMGTKDEVDAHVWEVHQNPETLGSSTELLEKNPLRCYLCCALADSEEALNLHIQECSAVNNAENLTCGNCGAIADTAEILSMHLETCGSELAENGDGIKDEIFSIKDDSNLIKEEVSEQVEQNGTFQEETMATPPGKKARTITCMACGETFASKPLLAEHERESPDHLAIECPDCGIQFPRERYLNEHREEFHDTLHCRHCRKPFSNIKQLKAHETRHIRASRSLFQCSTCERIFQTPTGLRHHMAVHTGDYKFKCEFCGKGFVSRVRSEEHRACHTKEKRYTCEVCGLKFSVQATYWIHRKWHENPKPYKCQECGMLFKHSSLLAVHKRKHTGERPYVCQHCDQSFIVSNSLKRHMTLHTGAFPYSCSICNVGFPAKHKKAQHMSKVHNDHTLLMEQISKKSRNLVMAVKDPEEEPKDLGETWVLAESAGSGQYLTLQTEGGERILLTEGMLQNSGDNQLVEIVLQGEQQNMEIQYQVHDEEIEQQL